MLCKLCVASCVMEGMQCKLCEVSYGGSNVVQAVLAMWCNLCVAFVVQATCRKLCDGRCAVQATCGTLWCPQLAIGT
eukprot:8694311-Pyramimonas_sp.AAC.1